MNSNTNSISLTDFNCSDDIIFFLGKHSYDDEIGDVFEIIDTISNVEYTTGGVQRYSYFFETEGNHEVEFTLNANYIGDYAFSNCSSLTSITIPDSVTTIGNSVFGGCSSLSSITCNATVAPTITNATFQGIKRYGSLYYPAGSDYSSWMSTDYGYLGYYNWTIEYI